jgi:pterin-4a-carbinolamine dehydratase
MSRIRLTEEDRERLAAHSAVDVLDRTRLAITRAYIEKDWQQAIVAVRELAELAREIRKPSL